MCCTTRDAYTCNASQSATVVTSAKLAAVCIALHRLQKDLLLHCPCIINQDLGQLPCGLWGATDRWCELMNCRVALECNVAVAAYLIETCMEHALHCLSFKAICNIHYTITDPSNASLWRIQLGSLTTAVLHPHQARTRHRSWPAQHSLQPNLSDTSDAVAEASSH